MRLSILTPVTKETALRDRISAGAAAYVDAERIQLELVWVDGAIRAAIARAAGDFCIVHEPKFDPDPANYRALLGPLIASDADVVIGSGALAFRTSLAQTVPLHSNGTGVYREMIVQFRKRHARIENVLLPHPCREQTIVVRWPLFALLSALRARLFAKAHTDLAADMLVAMSGANRFNCWMADTIAPWIKGDVLELGAGIGNLTVFLAPQVNRYMATDTDKEHLSELRSRVDHLPNVEIAVCDFSDPLTASRFQASADTIICLNVLEHIENDMESLANIRTYLRSRGTAIILVPQGPQVFGAMDEVLEHKRRYTVEELASKMGAAGFEIERMIMFNRITWPGWYLNSRILRRRTVGRLQLRLFDLLVPLWRRIDRHLPWPATSLIAIGVARD